MPTFAPVTCAHAGKLLRGFVFARKEGNISARAQLAVPPIKFHRMRGLSHSHAFLCPSTFAELLLSWGIPFSATKQRRAVRHVTITFGLGCQGMLCKFPRDGIDLRDRGKAAFYTRRCSGGAQAWKQCLHSIGN